MLLEQYVYEIKNMLSRDQDHITDRLIIRWMNTQRALWCKNEFNKNRTIDDVLKQTISGLELEMVDESEVSFISSTHRVKRTKLDIPRSIIRHHNDSIVSVRNSLILSEKYNYVPKDQAIYAGSGKLNYRDIFVFRYNDKMYVKLLKTDPRINLLTHLSIEGVWEDPVHVNETYIASNPDAYNPMEDEYPLNMAIWEYMKQQILQQGQLNLTAKEYEDKQD